MRLWFAEKFVSLLIEQHPWAYAKEFWAGCDLLKNSYLCLLNNTYVFPICIKMPVVICWKIRIFAYWTTPVLAANASFDLLWFAEKFVSLLIEQHRSPRGLEAAPGCDLLKNSYLCLLNNTFLPEAGDLAVLWFAEKFVSLLIEQHHISVNIS